MKGHIYTFFFVLIILLFVSCKKEHPVVPVTPAEEVDTCFCSPLKEPGIGFNCPSCDTDFDETYFGSPVINPNNENELIYRDGIYPNSKMMFYNLQTHEKRVLINENTSGNFSWSKKDWILFQKTAGFNLYKIKSNGDSLTQLTSGGKWFHGKWNYEGTKIIAHNKTKSYPRTEILNEQGMVIDSLTNWEHSGGYWSHPTYYLGGSTFEIMIMDIENRTVLKNLKFKTETSLVGWASLNEIMYRQGTKQYLYNINTDETKLIKCQCYTTYQTNTSSADFSKILFVKIQNSLQPNGRIFEDSKLVFMNKDGSGEYEIIP